MSSKIMKDHLKFVTDLMELRGWTMSDHGASYTRFDFKEMDEEAKKFAKKLGWVS